MHGKECKRNEGGMIGKEGLKGRKDGNKGEGKDGSMAWWNEARKDERKKTGHR